MHMSRFATLAALVLAVAPSAGRPNDSAAAIGVGGVQPREERRVSMRKERLFISPKKVWVEYEFVNESTQNVETEVAFPLPPYSHSYSRTLSTIRDFRVWVDGMQIPVKRQVRALHGGEDYAELLKQLGVDVEAFGYFNQVGETDQIASLSPHDREGLGRIGLVTEDGEPTWAVQSTWHWRQDFPPGKVVRVRHEYAPMVGWTYDRDFSDRLGDLPDACLDAKTKKAVEKLMLQKSATDGEALIWADSLEYILTTANTWKTPILHFELTVERPEGEYASFCWDGEVKRTGPRTFTARVKNFVPRKELTVYFLSVGGPRGPMD